MASFANTDVAVVTGAAKRLGRHIAVRLAQQFGLNIVVHCNRSFDEAQSVASEIRELGVNSIVVAADLSDAANCASTIFEAAAELGTVRALINCAAIFEDSMLSDIDVDHCSRHFAINVIAPLMLSQQFARQLGDSTGHIINMLDWRATRPGKDYLTYTASKAALAAATKGLAQQLAPRIQVNAIAPGAMLPPPDQPDWHDQRAAANIPLKRTGSPEDICDAICYLLQSDFVTGEVLHVSGGEQL